MKLRFLPLVVFALPAFPQAAMGVQTDFPPEEFRARWQKIFEKTGSSAVAVAQGVSLTPGFVKPRQSNEFYYLCGVETPHSYLLLDGRTKRATLYLPPRNRRLENAEGKVMSAEDADYAKQVTGADAVESTEVLKNDWLGKLPGGAPREVYTLLSPAEGAAQSRFELEAANAAIAADYWDGRLPRESRFAELVRSRYPRAQVKDLTPILDALPSVKSAKAACRGGKQPRNSRSESSADVAVLREFLRSAREIALIRRASQIASAGILEAMKSTRPGLFEYHLDAAARDQFLLNGARLEGYRSITASGTANIWNAHYYRNNGELKDGDLVLLDYAPDYRYYTSDVTRMWPVNGRFAPWQRELLGFVLEYRDAVIARIRPGVTVRRIMDEAKTAMDPVFARTKFSKPLYERAAHQLVETGGGVFSHPVGLTVHDDGSYNPGPLRPGHVFSIDPQLRVPEENLYIRYEDVVVVTETGVENFSASLVSRLEDIERTVRQGGGIVGKAPPQR